VDLRGRIIAHDIARSAQHERMDGETEPCRGGLQRLGIAHLEPPVHRRTLDRADDLDAAYAVDPDEDLVVPRQQSADRIGTEHPFTAEPDIETEQVHRELRLAARRLEGGARARDLAGEAAEQIGVIGIRVDDAATECALERLADLLLLAVAREEAHRDAVVRPRAGAGRVRHGELNAPPRLGRAATTT
jgi:hypothetical protein